MAAEARGPQVLDVGCGEGILGVLLARRGMEVTGVDINPHALRFARELLTREPEDVRGRVDLLQEDFLRTRGLSGLYDTVVMGEMLQCVDDPEAMLDRGLECLRPGGRLVATTPFGAPPNEDDRRTFSLTDMVELLSPRLGLEHLSVEDNHIRFVGSLSEDSEGSWQRLDAEAVLSMTGAALVASQTELYRMLEVRERRIERLQEGLQEQVELDRAARHTADTNRGEIKKLEFRVKLDQMALEQLKSQVDARTKELRSVTGKLQVTTRQLQSTLSSTSFRVGVAMVSAVRRPLKLLKLPLDLLQIYRSKPASQVESAASQKPAAQDGSTSEAAQLQAAEPYIDPDGPYVDPTKFIDFPVMSVPVASSGRPTVAAILGHVHRARPAV